MKKTVDQILHFVKENGSLLYVAKNSCRLVGVGQFQGKRIQAVAEVLQLGIKREMKGWHNLRRIASNEQQLEYLGVVSTGIDIER